jgi:hypothetical protein
MQPSLGKSTFSDERNVRGKVYVIDLDLGGIEVRAILRQFDVGRGDENGVLEMEILILSLGLEEEVVPTHQLFS